jgi:hypothetical protein
LKMNILVLSHFCMRAYSQWRILRKCTHTASRHYQSSSVSVSRRSMSDSILSGH